MKKIVVFSAFAIFIMSAMGQKIKNPSVRKSEVPNCKITSVYIDSDKTTIDFNYKSKTSNSSICVGDNLFIRDNMTGQKYFLIKAINIPICPEKHNFKQIDESLQFSMDFQPIPQTCKEIDIIENLAGVGFNYYGVNIKVSNEPERMETRETRESMERMETIESIHSFKSDSKSNNLTLSLEGKFKNKGDALGDILYMIPAGTTVKVLGKENGYYKVNYNGDIGYLSELYFNSSQSQKTENNSTNQSKECKSYFKDGKTFQYFVHNGVSVTMQLSIENSYGKYYVAYVAIENLTGNSFNFNPDQITALFQNKGKESIGNVLSAADYMNKVNRRQAWNAALVAFGESSSANQAGHSSSSTNSTTSGYANSYGSISGYYGDTYGSVQGNITTYGNSTTQSNTKSYNGSAAYAAKQNAQRNINNFQNQQYQIRNVLNEGYLKLNTINNEERIVGQINIVYQNADKIKITIPVNGNNYDFWWGE